MGPSLVNLSSASLSQRDESIGVKVNATNNETSTATDTVIPNW